MAKLRIQGLTEAVGTLKGIPAALEKSVLLQMSQIAYDSAQRGAGRHSKPGGTGALFQSLFNRAIPKGREVGHDPQRAPHALFVNAGTRPHIIEPKAGGGSNVTAAGPRRVGERKALRWAVGGRYIFAKRVHHPGYRGDAYVIEAAAEAVRQFRTIVDNAMRDANK